MSREDALIRIAAAILANPSINSMTANAADVVSQARRVVDRILEPASAPAPPPAAWQGSRAGSGIPSTATPPTLSAKPPRDGAWLVRAASKRACIAWFVAFGRERGFPSRMQFWSPAMVEQAVTARHNAALVNGVMP